MALMLKLQLPKNRMNYLIKQVQQHYDAEVLEKGWEYYHKSRVLDVELVGTTIQALVQGAKTYETVVHLEDFSYSECSCTYDGFCKHIAAAFFSLYAPYGRPELLLQELKQAIRSRRKPLRPAAAAPERKTPVPAVPQEAGPPGEWHRFFETKFHGFSISHQNSIETFYDSALETLPGYAADWRPAARELFRLHIVLFMMKKIEQFYRDTKSSYLSYYHENGCKAVARQCEEQLTAAVRRLNTETLPANEPALWRATLTMISELAMQGTDSPIDWLLAYRRVWWRVPQQELQREEIRRLDMLLARPEGTTRRRERDTLLIARAHFDVIGGRSAEAFTRLGGLQSPNAGDFFLYLQHYEQQRQWLEMLVWLRWLLPAMEKANHEDFRTFCQYWMDTAKQLDSDAEWVRVMESLLPRSYYYYTAYLLQTRRYRQWVDLQLANRISPLSLYALELKAIEEHDPSLLLPLYHQAAERAIQEKNRASYKTAIRLLKKLHGFYRQLGQEQRWELYVYRLADKFSRLRAFQEELKKGKWIR